MRKNDYRIIRAFFHYAYSGKNFDDYRVILVNPKMSRVVIPIAGGTTKSVDLETYTVINCPITRYEKVSKIKIGCDEETRTLFVGDGSYRYKFYNDQ